MRYAWSQMVAVTLGAGMLWGGMALAKSPKQQEHEERHDGCTGACKQDEKTCTEACKKHAREGAALCMKACGDLHKECEQDCQKPRGKK